MFVLFPSSFWEGKRETQCRALSSIGFNLHRYIKWLCVISVMLHFWNEMQISPTTYRFLLAARRNRRNKIKDIHGHLGVDFFSHRRCCFDAGNSWTLKKGNF